MPECWGNVVDTIYMHLCMHIYTDRLGADFHDTARSLCPFLLDKLKDKNKGVVETTHAALDCMIEWVQGLLFSGLCIWCMQWALHSYQLIYAGHNMFTNDVRHAQTLLCKWPHFFHMWCHANIGTSQYCWPCLIFVKIVMLFLTATSMHLLRGRISPPIWCMFCKHSNSFTLEDVADCVATALGKASTPKVAYYMYLHCTNVF